jgi:hypothetical protein
MSVKPFLIWILLAAANSALAQHASDTGLKGSTIEVLQSYKPQVKQVPKPEWTPQLPPPDTTHPDFSYEVPQQTLYYTYSSLPLRPLALGLDSSRFPFRNYVKAGGGNLSTIFIDAGIGSFSGQNYETALHLHHLSQRGSDIQYQQSSQSGAEADGVLHRKKSDIHAGLMYERNQYNYYGYDHSISLPDDSVYQVYNTIRLGIDLKNRTDSSGLLSYHPAMNFSLYNAKFNSLETTFGFNAPLSYRFDSTLTAEVAILGAVTSYKNDAGSTSNNFIEALPGLTLNGGKLTGHALLGLAIGKGGSFYLLPDIFAAYPLGKLKMNVTAGWRASLRQNTYEQMTTANPYLSPAYQVEQTRKDEVFAGLQASRGSHLDFSARVSWWGYKNLPSYLNDMGDQKQFYISYLNVNAASLQATARYHVANMWSLGITADFYNFYGKTQAKVYVWGEPNMKIKGDFTLTPIPKLMVTAYLALLGGIYEKDNQGNVVKLDMIADIGGNAEYQIVPRLSAFVQVNNILNNKYQRWYQYEVYGLNIYGGIRLKF